MSQVCLSCFVFTLWWIIMLLKVRTHLKSLRCCCAGKILRNLFLDLAAQNCPNCFQSLPKNRNSETNNGTTAVEMFSRHHAMWLIDHTRSINRSVSFHLSKKQKVLFGLNRVNTDKNREHSALEMCVSVTQVHTHTHTSSLSTSLFQQHRRVWWRLL